jgi:hydroxymethylglutaryl-CoA lyase
MSEAVKIIECPRDAWQGLPVQMPSEVKAAYLRQLIDAGFSQIDAVSFVSPKAVPQMADSERVLELLAPPEHVEIIAIVANEKGADRAIRTGAVRTLGFPFSCSAQFLERNQRQTPEEALKRLREMVKMANDAGLGVVAHLSMGFGNPYGDPWSISEVIRSCESLIEAGVSHISLADTVGLATPERISETIAAALDSFYGFEIGVHLHARRKDARAVIRAAYGAGCRLFEGAMGGLGGCPFAQDALVGNLPTEELVATLRECGAPLPELRPLDALLSATAEIAAQYGSAGK